MSDFPQPQIGSDDPVDLVAFDDALPIVFGFLMRRCGHRDLAEELTSATFVSAVANRPGHSWAAPWLITIARNKLIDHWRREARAETATERLQKSRPQTTTMFVEERLEVAAVLGRLSADHQMILALRHIDDMTVPQCAEHVGRSVQATESLLRRAQETFRTEWNHRRTEAE